MTNIEQEKTKIQSVMQNAQVEFEAVGRQIAQLTQQQQQLREIYLRAEGAMALVAELEAKDGTNATE